MLWLLSSKIGAMGFLRCCDGVERHYSPHAVSCNPGYKIDMLMSRRVIEYI